MSRDNINLTSIALSIVVLGVVTGIGAIVLINIRNNRLTDLPVITTTNETLNSMTQITQTLTTPWVKSVTACVNATSGANIGSGNWTLTPENVNFGSATIKVAEGIAQPGVINNTNWKCTYTSYNVSQADWATADKAAVGLTEYGNWFKILVIVGVAAVILGLIYLAFGNAKGVGESGASGAGVSY